MRAALVTAAAVGLTTAVHAQETSLHDSDGLIITRSENPPKLIIEATSKSAKALDGDTLWLSIFKIRLKGIDTVETKQSCRATGDVQCAEQSRRELQSLMGGSSVRCEVQFDSRGRPAMNHSRYVATCNAGSTEINLALVQSGWAFADEKATVPMYHHAQLAAEGAKLGMHKFGAEKPWLFRKRTKGGKGSDIADIPCPPGQSSKRFCTVQP